MFAEIKKLNSLEELKNYFESIVDNKISELNNYIDTLSAEQRDS